MLKNEKGITLIVVLLMITVFSILGMSVIGYTLTNSKQVQKSEVEIQAVDLAEMGVVHFKNLFIVNAATVLNSIINDINQRVQAPNSSLVTSDQVETAFYDELRKYIEEDNDNDNIFGFIPTVTYPNSKNISSGFSYTINKPKQTRLEETEEIVDGKRVKKKKISVTVTTIGKTEREEPITITIDLYVNTLVDFDGQGSGSDDGGSNGYWTGTWTVPTKPTDLNTKCPVTTPSKLNELPYNACYTSSDYIPNSSNQSFINNILYIDGDLIMSNGSGEFNNSHIYVTGIGSFGNFNKGIIDSTIYIGGKVEAGEEQLTSIGNLQFNGGGIIRSSLYIFGNTSIDQIKEGIRDNSTIYVEGNLDFKNQIGEIDSTSKICVSGEVRDQQGKIVVRDRIFSSITDRQTYITNCPRVEEKKNGSKIPSITESDIAAKLDNLEIQYDY